ncbi:hypothetical protein ASL11_19030 [Paenibacillus sp. Soil750]|nr:hypothetical protein ASL11_19030 [Paenibacillus sp. Soil750]
MGDQVCQKQVALLGQNAYDEVTQEGKAGQRLFVINSARTRKRDGNVGFIGLLLRGELTR